MPFRLFQHSLLSTNPSAQDLIIIVSGLPRSGTSMMMRMLEAGGIPVLVDQQRTPDTSNPKGYYEYENVKRMKEGDTGWMKEARGKAVKIISPLLEYLPLGHHYRIVFMQRNMAEILASQREMLIRRGETKDTIDDRYLADLYQKHLVKITDWIARQPNLEVTYLNYNQIVQEPQPHITQLVRFLNPIQLESTRMLNTIETSLYRQRGGNPLESPTKP